MDSALIQEGAKRCSMPKFYMGIAIVGVVVLWGLYALGLIYWKGLNQTNMNDYYGFALWIWADLAVIAVGGGAFFTGLLKYIFNIEELKNIINFAVIIGFVCYSSALMILGMDVGQPLRFWFIYWHANIHSMLTEVAFCLTAYFAVLAIEFIPTILENRQANKVPFFHHLAHNMHGVMAIFAATGAFLSFFHQGSLGGVSGVMFGRPFAVREGLLIWPWTFFLYTWSAAAFGPCFTLLVTRIIETITNKKLVGDYTLANSVTEEIVNSVTFSPWCISLLITVQLWVKPLSIATCTRGPRQKGTINLLVQDPIHYLQLSRYTIR
jgi:Ni/Fe-hydrogenase subunit HybB-like protein